MSVTNNLSLNLFTPGVDMDEGFQSYRLKLSGPEDSNMIMIDDEFATFPTLLAALSSAASGSKTTVTKTLNSISGSIAVINSDLDTIDARLVKLNEHSGSGQADFNNISGSYTHILILGVATGLLGSGSGAIHNIGIDFNGDTNTSNYASIQWKTSGSYLDGNNWEDEDLYETSSNGQIVISAIGDSNLFDGFGTAFLALIPNYSSSGSLYKTALGISAFMGDMVGFTNYGFNSLSVQGGYWNSLSAITRIRIFSGSSIATRYNFATGTKITMYGLI